ncbi:MAG: type II secretion system protein [Candidatus Jorgensenbacteria bacterium]
MTNNKRSGFTLIEMLVVVAIIGLLSSVVVVGIGGAREKARDTKRVADLRSIQSYLEVNYNSATGYPDIAATYPASLPTDPSNSATKYSYCRTSDNQSYVLGTKLENVGNRPSGGVSTLPTGCTILPTLACSAAGVEYCITN